MMRKAALVFALVMVSTVLAGPQAPQAQQAATPAPAWPGSVLTVTGLVPKRLELDAAAFGRLPRRSVRATDHDGREVEYEGVPLAELLKAAGLDLTPDRLRGNALEYYLVVGASDGYRVVFALPELSPAFTDRVVILADRRGGQPLGGKEGPLRVIVPGEKRQARWVRQVSSLKVREDGE